MKIINETGTFEIWSMTASNPTSDLVIGSKSLESLWQMLDSISLAGVSEDNQRPKDYYQMLVESIDDDQELPSGDRGYTIILDRGTVCLWLNFEVLNYLLYDFEEYETH